MHFSIMFAVAVTAGAAYAKDAPYVGKWDCEVANFTFSASSFDYGDGPRKASKIEFDGTDAWRMEFEDGYSFVVQPHTGGKTMTWMSLASGDTFECSRLK